MNPCLPEAFYAMAFTVTIYVWIRHVHLPASTSASIPGSCLKLGTHWRGVGYRGCHGGYSVDVVL